MQQVIVECSPLNHTLDYKYCAKRLTKDKTQCCESGAHWILWCTAVQLLLSLQVLANLNSGYDYYPLKSNSNEIMSRPAKKNPPYTYIVHVIILPFERVLMVLHTFNKIFVKTKAVEFIFCHKRFKYEPETLSHPGKLLHIFVWGEFWIMG